jgi:hypothetical protein
VGRNELKVNIELRSLVSLWLTEVYFESLTFLS